MKYPCLIGEKVYLRPMQLTEMEHYLEWLNDVQVTRSLGRPFYPLTREAEEDFYRKILPGSRDNVFFAIALKEDDRHIGSCGLHQIDWISRKAELGILIGDKSCWNHGYGTESVQLITDYGFRWMNLHRIFLRVHQDNTGGIAAYRRAGFVDEGCMRDETYRDGTFVSTLIMSVLESEWRMRNSG